MAFTYTSSVKKVLTHTQFMNSDQGEVGIETLIQKIMYNDKWLTVTFFGEKFKLNIKYSSDDELMKAWTQICSTLDEVPCKAILRDDSEEDLSEMNCEVILEQAPKSKGGRNYKWERGVCTFESKPSSKGK